MRIGFISILGERGQWYVTKNFMQALQDDHELFLFARPFRVRDGTFIGNLDDYGIKAGFEMSQTYEMSSPTVKKWVEKNKLDVVFFNEELNWTLVSAAKNAGAKVVTYLDYFTAATIDTFKEYDKVFICAKHAYDVFKAKGLTNIEFIDWGVDTEAFKPTPDDGKATFFHSAGWGGVNWRKCSPDVLRAMNTLYQKGRKYNMFFHSQTALHQYDKESQHIIEELTSAGVLEAHFGSVSHPGLYYKGKINVAPSKLEGLGLYLPEGLSSGMPTITTDAPPMNQWVQTDVNGVLIPTTGSHYRDDPYFFPEYDIDKHALVEAMDYLGSSPERVAEMAAEARRGIELTNSYALFASHVKRLISSL